MRPVAGTITDRRMDALLAPSSRETLEAIPTQGDTLTLNDYQAGAATTAVYPRVYTEDQVRLMLARALAQYGDGYYADLYEQIADQLLDWFETPFNRLVYPLMGLAGEIGEVLNKSKKIARDSQGQMDLEAVEDSVAELGDITWYTARVASELGVSLGDVAQANLDKLASRKQRGVLGGSGDNR